MPTVRPSVCPNTMLKRTPLAFTQALKVNRTNLLNLLWIDGMIYFVRGDTIGSDFGFPRLEFKKRFKWYANLNSHYL